jgi:hypothetical protein
MDGPRVEAIAGGDRGWLAVTGDRDSLVSLWSADGDRWRTAPLSRSSGATSPTVMVGEEVLVVAATTTGVDLWVGGDGEHWARTRIWEGVGEVLALSELDAGLVAAGSAEGSPAVWWPRPAGWEPLVAPGPGWVGALIELDGTILALGSAGGSPAGWRVEGPRLVQVPVDVGDPVEGGFLAVSVDPAGGWSALVGQRGEAARRRSHDGLAWSGGEPVPAGADDLVVVDPAPEARLGIVIEGTMFRRVRLDYADMPGDGPPVRADGSPALALVEATATGATLWLPST